MSLKIISTSAEYTDLPAMPGKSVSIRNYTGHTISVRYKTASNTEDRNDIKGDHVIELPIKSTSSEIQIKSDGDYDGVNIVVNNGESWRF